MHVNEIRFNKDYRCFKKGFTLQPKQLTILVGDQGTGKSSLLEGMIGNRDEVISVKVGKSVDVFYFDSEKMNPRITDPIMYTNPNGTNTGIGYGGAFASRFKSHGEILVNYTVDGLRKASNSVLLFDEPESALSLKNQFRLIESIEIALKNDCQLFIATHNYLIIKHFKEVYDLESKMWVNSKVYLSEIMDKVEL